MSAAVGLGEESLLASSGSEAHGRRALGAATFTSESCNRKLSPTKSKITGGRERFTPTGPFVSVTYTSIEATCPDECVHKGVDCYEQVGLTQFRARRRDLAAQGYTALEIIAEEVRVIDAAFDGGPVPQNGACGGQDLRLHAGGDVGCEDGAPLLGEAAGRWIERGGGTVWTYTHLWREIPRIAWGPSISVLASVERPEDIDAARARGYAAAITLEKFPSEKAFFLPGSTAKIIPCPAETTDGRVTCVECRLCLDRDLLGMNRAIGFELHGRDRKKAAEALVQLRSSKNARAPGTEVAS